MAGGKKWTNEEDIILIENYNKIDIKSLEELLPHRTYYSIVKRAQVIGCNDKGNYSHKKYSVNNNFFKDINQENSYWAGFIGADGTIYGDTNVVAIKLQARDVEILEELKLVTNFTGNIKVYERYTIGPDIRKTCSINICGVPNWIKDLNNNFNVIPNKSLILQPPNLNKECSLAYIKGYIDGNGSISLSKTNNPKISISTSEQVSNWIEIFTQVNYGFNFNIYQRQTTQVYNLFRLDKSGKPIVKFLKDVNDSHTFGLNRKWQKLSPLIK